MPSAYGIAHLKNPNLHADVLEDLERIQATLDPFDGHFIVHGPTVRVLEGEWPGSIVVIEFPSVEHAQGWYDSPAYREVIGLRLKATNGFAVLAHGRS